MIVRRSDMALIAAAGLCAVVVPAWLLSPRAPAPGSAEDVAIIRPKPAPELAPSDRRFFASEGDAQTSALPSDAPDLVGIVGRPPHDAVALVRTAEGTTKVLAPGQSYAGWRLEAVSAEAVLFSRGPLQIRVPMPALDPREGSEVQ